MLAAHDDPAFQQRVRAAAALRSLGHAIVGHDVDAGLFDEIATQVEEWLPRLEASPPRQRPIGPMKRDMFSHPPADGAVMEHFPDCVVSGSANPMGVAISMRREGDQAVARVTLGAAFEGAPGRAHGGIVAALFDDTMGYVLTMLPQPAFTGELTIRYEAPTPVGVEIEFRAGLKDRDGRKLWIDGEACHDGKRIASASGLFISIPLERFSLTATG